jgi:hypothetical protein
VKRGASGNKTTVGKADALKILRKEMALIIETKGYSLQIYF